MMKIRVKAPWMDGKGLHKIGDILDVETAAFNPLSMIEIRGKATASEDKPEKPAKTTRKTTKKG